MSARAPNSAVIARLDRATQYAAASRFDRTCSGILDPRFRGDDEETRSRAPNSAVIVRLDRATQYAAASQFNRTCSGILDPRFRGDDALSLGT